MVVATAPKSKTRQKRLTGESNGSPVNVISLKNSDPKDGSADDPGEVYEIECFQCGTHVSSDGSEHTITEDQVDQAIDAYDPGSFRVPLIVSHSTAGIADNKLPDSELAFGVVEAFRRQGKRVYAQFKKIASQFKEWVQQGQIHSVSASFYLPGAKSSPNPQHLMFRHIAALGRSQPAVKGMEGLKLAEFPCFSATEDPSGIVAFAYYYGNDTPLAGIAAVLMNLKGWITEQSDRETADSLLPPDILTMLIATAGQRYLEVNDYWQSFDRINERVYQLEKLLAKQDGSPTESLAPIYNEGEEPGMTTQGQATATGALASQPQTPPQAQFTQVQADGATDQNYIALQQQNDALMKQLVNLHLTNRRSNVIAFLEGQKASGRVTPAMLAALPISFAENGQNQQGNMDLVGFMASLPEAQLNYMQAFIAGLPVQVQRQQVFGTEPINPQPNFTQAIDANGNVTFAAAKPPVITEEMLAQLAKKKKNEAKKAGINLSDMDAIQQVIAEYGSPTAVPAAS